MPARTTIPALLKLEEVATVSRAPIGSVRHWVATGALASVKVGRRRLVRRADLAAFLDTPIEQLSA